MNVAKANDAWPLVSWFSFVLTAWNLWKPLGQQESQTD